MSETSGSRVERTFRADRHSLRGIRAFIGVQSVVAGLDGRDRDDVLVAVNEACSNVVLHAGSSRIELVWATSPDEVEIVVRDAGVFTHDETGRERDELAPSGRGIGLMRATMDELVIEPGTPSAPGTRVRMVKRKGRVRTGSEGAR